MATGDDPITWSITNFESHPFPDWLTIDAGTGTISGTPASEGHFAFTVQASNAYGTDSCGFGIEVKAEGHAPATWKYSLSPAKNKTVSKGGIITYKRYAAKGENIKYTYNKKKIPSGNYLYNVFVWDRAGGAVKAGESYVKFSLKYLGETHDYEFKENAIKAENTYGTSYSIAKTVTVTQKNKNQGTIGLAALGGEGGLVTVADGEDDDGEELSGTQRRH